MLPPVAFRIFEPSPFPFGMLPNGRRFGSMPAKNISRRRKGRRILACEFERNLDQSVSHSGVVHRSEHILHFSQALDEAERAAPRVNRQEKFACVAQFFERG